MICKHGNVSIFCGACENESDAVDTQPVPRDEAASTQLYPCALCGSTQGYFFAQEGQSFWAALKCVSCRRALAQARSRQAVVYRSADADEAWNTANARSHAMEKALRRASQSVSAMQRALTEAQRAMAEAVTRTQAVSTHETLRRLRGE